jgi:hypothetical protein
VAGYRQLAQLVRTANARLHSARDLEARWNALSPEEQADARAELETVKAATVALRARLTHGPRGFVREFGAAYQGKESESPDAPRPLAQLAGELHAATKALRAKLDAGAEANATTATNEPPTPIPAAESPAPPAG